MDPKLRHRHPPAPSSSSSPTPTNPTTDPDPSPPPRRARLPHLVLDTLRLLTALLLLNSLLSYFITSDPLFWSQPRPWFLRPGPLSTYLFHSPLHLTDAELSLYNGTDPRKPVLLALNGTIYDVSAGKRVYGPGGSYHVFAGKDAARGFVTGCFVEDGVPDLRGVEWTYVPVGIPRFGEEEEGEGEGEVGQGMQGEGDGKGRGGEEEEVGRKDKKVKKRVSPELKSQREQALRQARKQVKATIEGWGKMFRGETGKGYFEVGKVVREEGWLERLPRREICAQAERGRPKGKEGSGRDAGAAYRGGA
ncbi:hypothetical protein D0864_16675 [Hortaea werneckii]|uniref:Cytochrome b5 heme-binding domain-containing protein n=1 Tax=Hortaea werneckii TaxID=91943 RepID=A0A3M7B559_HORWE|nr:hypothetical protein KC322_g1476 [Hortaea werneckii]RMY34839.1 hypothetical protein D0864_16675 [Hortaea werneckii]